MRCLALARALMARGAACAMLAPPPAAGVLEAFAPPELWRIDAPSAVARDLATTAREAAGRWAADLVFVDHYDLAGADERQLGAPAAVIDDLADRDHACRLLVDPTLGRTADAYRSLTPADCRVLTGPEFALLAPGFAQARTAALAGRRPQDLPRRLLISLGLMDLRGITGAVLELILPLLGEVQVDVVVGSVAPSLPALRAAAGSDGRIRLHVDSRDMPGLIASADIGIGAGGVSTWERAALGLPSISVILADNQRELAGELGRRGALLAVEAWTDDLAKDLPSAFTLLIGDGATRKRLSETSAALCDGGGADRVAEAILALI